MSFPGRNGYKGYPDKPAKRSRIAKPKIAWGLVPVGELLDKMTDAKEDQALIEYKDRTWLIKLKENKT
jgi:hypothetical protein